MAYQALVVNLLISAPGDVTPEDIEIVVRAVSQWNVNYGQKFSMNVQPVFWAEHATAEFGDRPQALINNQIVSTSDFVVAIFRDRLGTPTGEAVSGTAEEIQVMARAGKYVGILVDESPRPPLDIKQAEERQRLMSYLAEIKENAIVFGYSDSSQLKQHLDNFLSRATGRLQKSAEQSIEEMLDPSGLDAKEGVWPRVEFHEGTDTDSKGRLKTTKKWYFVLENTYRGPAKEVTFDFEGISEGELFRVGDGKGEAGTIPPGSEMRFPLILAWGSPSAVDCSVTWTDINDNRQVTTATIRV